MNIFLEQSRQLFYKFHGWKWNLEALERKIVKEAVFLFLFCWLLRYAGEPDTELLPDLHIGTELTQPRRFGSSYLLRPRTPNLLRHYSVSTDCVQSEHHGLFSRPNYQNGGLQDGRQSSMLLRPDWEPRYTPKKFK